MKLKQLIEESKRILRLARKPTKEEFLQIAKITAIGIAILGMIGYVFQFIFTFFGLLRG